MCPEMTRVPRGRRERWGVESGRVADFVRPAGRGEILSIRNPSSQGGGRCPLGLPGAAGVILRRTGRDFDLPRHFHYSGVIPMVFQHSARSYGVST